MDTTDQNIEDGTADYCEHEPEERDFICTLAGPEFLLSQKLGYECIRVRFSKSILWKTIYIYIFITCVIVVVVVIVFRFMKFGRMNARVNHCSEAY